MANERRGVSIRRVWSVSTGALLALTVTAAVFMRVQSLRVVAEIRADNARAERQRRSIDGRLAAMVNQEVGLRGFLASGEREFLEPYDRGRAEEERWRAELASTTLADEDRAELAVALGLERSAARRWHDEIAAPQIAARRAGAAVDLRASLTDGKRRFDDYRAAWGTLDQAFERTAAARERRRHDELVHANVVAGLVLAFLVFAGAVVSREIVRRTAAPLTALSDAAERGDVSTAAVRASGLREVIVLAETLEQLFRAVSERAMRDGLTRAYNRGFLAEWLPRQMRLVRRNGAPLAALMVDVDHFKRINDTNGHAAGDQVLVSLARCIERQLRASDVVVRYGGEEFTVLLPDTAVAGAFVSAERLRAAIAAMTERDGLPAGLRVTASIGVAAINKGEDGAQLLKRADAALYEAKRSGRNRVVTAPPAARAAAEPARLAS